MSALKGRCGRGKARNPHVPREMILAGPERTIRVGGYQGEASVHTQSLRAFAAEVERELPGWRIEVTPNVADLGHKAADCLAMVADGRLELCYFNSSYLAERVPSFALFDIPFALAERENVYRKLDGALGRTLAADVAAATRYRLLDFWDNGFRHISNRAHPIRAPQDCAGLKLRIVASPLHKEVFAALGFEPVVVDVKDLVAAVNRYAVDAQENPLTNLVNFALHRAHRHVSLTSHFFGVALVLANRAWLDGLDGEVRAALTAAMPRATARQRALARAEDARCLAVLANDGVAVVPADGIDFAAFRAAVAPIVSRELARLPEMLRAALDA
jgi:tripartite ATP-independent transporter DctP family solute receptor